MRHKKAPKNKHQSCIQNGGQVWKRLLYLHKNAVQGRDAGNGQAQEQDQQEKEVGTGGTKCPFSWTAVGIEGELELRRGEIQQVSA